MTTQIIQTRIDPIVPANASLNVIEINAQNTPVQLIYPTTFIQSPYYLAAAIIITQPIGFSDGTLVMPNALQIPQSIVCQFINTSASPFTLLNFEGEVIRVIEPGKMILLYMLPSSNPPTPAGNFYTAEIGAGSSGQDPAALAGFGLIALDNNKLNCFIESNVFDVPFVLTNDFDASLITWTGGTYTIDLDTLASPIPGFYCMVKNASPSVLTLQASNIDGGTTIDLIPNQSCIIVYDNTFSNWKTVGLGSFSFGNAVQFTSTGIRLTNGSATNPSLAYIADPSTGLFSKGTSDVSITNSGAESISFTQEGPVLIVGNYMLGGDLLLEYAGIYP
jgi:hypothetical protein